ncbi:MAG: hypothetical protein BWK79_09295 [Beggiatoa sp. IS2]|nr:MAG: hypothetical protein BWK79_09295 [Beggiatoa sp. IS2]
MDTSLLYENDYNAWIIRHIQLLQQGQFSDIDIDHLIEELEYMAKRDRHELVSHFIILLAHLLKWQFQLNQLAELLKNFHGTSWRASIAEQRLQIQRQLELSPSLKPYLTEALYKAYPKAIELAVRETQLAVSLFPTICPYSLEQTLNEEFYPE